MRNAAAKAITIGLLLVPAGAYAQRRSATPPSKAKQTHPRSAAADTSAILALPLKAGAPFKTVIVTIGEDTYACGSLGCEITFYGVTASGKRQDISQDDIFKNGVLGTKAQVFGAIDAAGMPVIVLEQGLINGGNSFNLFTWRPALRRYAFAGKVSGYAAGKTVKAATIPAAPLAAAEPAPAKPPTVSLFDTGLSFCTNATDTACEYIIGPPFTGRYLDPACQHNDLALRTCADNAIRIADNKGLTSIYLIYFEQGMPQMRSGGVLPLDRFYTGALLQKNKKGEWKNKGQHDLSGLFNCPDYGLSSLHMRQITGLPDATSIARFVKCDVPNKGEFTYRDLALTGDPPFFRPGTGNSQSPQQPSAPPVVGAATSSVWGLGRVRILVERGRRCGLDESLGKPFCFGEAIAWLRRRPQRTEIDVIAMDNAFVPGSMIPYNSGRGWSVYRVARAGENFSADGQRHFATKVQVPQGCIYQGVQQDAWYITVARGRRVAVEAKLYSCAGWRGPSLYAGNADYSFVDSGALDYTGTAQAYQAAHPELSAGRGPTAGRSTFGIPEGPIYGGGDSTDIYGDPGGSAPTAQPSTRPKRKR